MGKENAVKHIKMMMSRHEEALSSVYCIEYNFCFSFLGLSR
jgi:hypothetical protein